MSEQKKCSNCCCEYVCQIHNEVEQLIDKNYYNQIRDRYKFVESLAIYCKNYKEVNENERAEG